MAQRLYQPYIQPHIHICHPHWIKAMNEELQALEENLTWVVTDWPLNKKLIGCKWLLKTKYLPNGDIERHKARLVILGNKHKHGIDYLETFAPVAKLTTIRSLLVVAAIGDWEVYSWMSKMPSFMGTLMKLCTRLFLLDTVVLANSLHLTFPPPLSTSNNTFTKNANYKKTYMV